MYIQEKIGALSEARCNVGLDIAMTMALRDSSLFEDRVSWGCETVMLEMSQRFLIMNQIRDNDMRVGGTAHYGLCGSLSLVPLSQS